MKGEGRQKSTAADKIYVQNLLIFSVDSATPRTCN